MKTVQDYHFPLCPIITNILLKISSQTRLGNECMSFLLITILQVGRKQFVFLMQEVFAVDFNAFLILLPL